MEFDVQATLSRARQQEQECEWLEASKSYEKVLSSERARTFSVAQTWEKLAFCYCEASRQAIDKEQFRRLRQQSADAYKTAAKLFGAQTSSESEGKSAQCNALSAYVSSWLASTPSEKKRILEESLEFGRRSLVAYQRAGEELAYGRMCNDFSTCLLERLYIASDYSEICSFGQEGMECVGKALTMLSKNGEKNELLRAYYTISLLTYYLANYGNQEETAQKEMVQKSLSCAEKALELSKEINNPYAAAMANWAAAYCALVFTEKADSALECAKAMLEQGIIAKDNFLRGVAHYLQAFVTDMKTLGEADPEKQEKGHKRTIQHSQEAIHYLSIVCQDLFLAETYTLYSEGYSSLASNVEVGLEEKRSLLEKAVEAGRKGLQHANASGSQEVKFSTLHVLSKALKSCSNIANETDEKIRLLEEALEKRTEFSKVVERAFPFNNWLRGVGKNYEGLIRVELARIEENKIKKVAILKSSLTNMEDSVLHCKRWIDSRPVPSYIAAVAGYEDTLGETLNELYQLVEDKEILTRAIEVHEDAAKHFKKVNVPSRAAESYWKIARNHDCLGDHQKAAENFASAMAEYKAAAERIPHFSGFYLDYALYMKGWGEIEHARFAHEREKYSDAMEHYENIANLFKPSKLWGYLSSNFQAWAFLERAEDLSRIESRRESIEAFRHAGGLFEEARKGFEGKIGCIRDSDEKQKAVELSEASIIRRDYCLARVYVEEARSLDLEGNHGESAEKYGVAASSFEKILEKTEVEDFRKEIKPIAYMCRAWQKMKVADVRAVPELYHQASELFLEAKEHSTKDRATLLASGNGAVCMALEYGTRFELMHDKGDFARAKQHLESASNYYLRAGFENASVWTSAAETLLDAYDYMAGAETESNPERKTKAYLLAEKCLEKSAELYETAGYVGRRDEARRTLKKVQEKREFAMSLGEMLTAPGDASSTRAISAPISTVEEPVGLQKFEHEVIHANLIAQSKEVAVGEDLNLEIELANLGKTTALIRRVEDLIPEGFEIVGEPKTFRVENGCLDMKGKRLGPLETEEFKLVLRSSVKGKFEIEPTIIYSGENGRESSCEPEPVTLNVSRTVLPDRVATGFEDLDELLLGGIPKNYAVILTSPSIDERDMLVHRYLETGARKDEIIFHVTIDTSYVRTIARELQPNFYLFLCNPQVDETLKNLPNLIRLKGVENLTEINIALISAFRRLDAAGAAPRRACIEIISDALLQHHALSVRKWLATLIPEFRSRGFITLGVMNPQMHPPEEVQAILDVFDGEISVFERETKRGFEKFLRIRKMYAQRYLDRELLLNKEKFHA
jgi:KaiC/GvpD/RAD55 family RecA-like ATPase